MTDLSIINNHQLPAAYQDMATSIEKAWPAIERDTANFNKSHSQFMISLLDIAQLTPMRAIKHTLAEINRTKRAIEEATISIKKDDVELLELKTRRNNRQASMEGAVRKLAHLTAQHKALLDKIGKDHITEADYEEEEARYHTMTVIKQALCAARSRGGVIDEGNNIYLFDMGLPASLVQRRILEYLASETEQTTHADTIAWMEALADEIQHYAAENAERRGVVIRDDKSILGAPDADNSL